MRRDVTNCPRVYSEDRGVNTKEWIEVDNREALFKETQIKDNGETTYADYAEGIVSDLCALLDIPCAEVELVERDGKLGCLSYSFCDKKKQELIDMGSIIQNVRIRFNSKAMIDEETKEVYKIDMILEAIESVCSSKREFAAARKALLKDILLDSLVDHYDRNPSNLSMIRDRNGIYLSPKYDNGTSLSVSVPEEVLKRLLTDYPTEKEAHQTLRSKVYSKIGYLNQKYVGYPGLESYIFSYYFDDVKDFVGTIEEKLTDEEIDRIVSQEKYAGLGEVQKEIVRGKLRTNRDRMLERFRAISKKVAVDKIIYSKAAKTNYLSATRRGQIQKILPELAMCEGVKDDDSDYAETLDMQIPEKIQSIVDIEQLSRYFRIPVLPLTKREKVLAKWVSIIENIQKASKDDKNYLDDITTRLGFVEEDKDLMHYLIKDKFKDENDVLEARDIIFGDNGIGEENVNLYMAKKFVDASTMRTDIRDQRMEELRIFYSTMQEAIELEHIVRDKVPVKTRTVNNFGLHDKAKLVEIQFEIARRLRANPRLKAPEMIDMARQLAKDALNTPDKEEVQEGVFVPKAEAEEVRKHCRTLKNGKTLAIFVGNTELAETAKLMGIDYFGQIIDHPSGEGVTCQFTTKRGGIFPTKFLDYASGIDKSLKGKFKPGSIIFKTPTGKKTVGCFIVSSLKDPDAKIPGKTAEKMKDEVVEIFEDREQNKGLDDE